MAVKILRCYMHKGSAYQRMDEREGAKGVLFEKDVLAVGEWFHPVTGERLEFDLERLQQLAASTNRWMEIVDNEVMFPNGHSFDVLDNLGVWHPPFRVVGERLMGIVEVLNQEAVEKVEDKTLRGVSVFIEFNALGQDGQMLPEVITHVAATNEPVITGQEEFQKLSISILEKQGAELFLSRSLGLTGGVPMNEEMKKLAKALGLDPEKTTEAAVLKAAEELSAANKKAGEDATTALTGVTDALKAKGLQMVDGVVIDIPAIDTAPKPGDTPEVASMRKEMAEVRRDQRLSQAMAVKTTVEQLIKDGKIPPGLQDKALAICGLVGQAQSLSLGKGGDVAATMVEAGPLIREFLAELPSWTTSLSKAGRGPDPEGDEAAEANRKKGVELAKRREAASSGKTS